MNRWKAVPWVVGVALLAVSLVAARMNADPSAGGAAPPPAAPLAGLTTTGTVDTPLGVLALQPPGVVGMASLTVQKVNVVEGATVKPGDVLVEFDAGGLPHKLKQAEGALFAAQWEAKQAAWKRDNDHKKEVAKAKLGVKKAEDDFAAAERAEKLAKDALEKTLAALTNLTEAQKAERRQLNPEVIAAENLVRQAKQAVEAAKLDLERAEGSKEHWEDLVQAANAKVQSVQAQFDEATAAVEVFKLKALVGGRVEQVAVAKGMTVGPTSRTPLLYLIPDGPRVVRAEVEAEFAHKIDAFVGKPVTISAGEKFTDTYPGIARRVNTAYLPKRFGGDSLVNGPTRALECTIDITDPAPPGKPPLRPGQPVRVTFGQ